MVGEAKPTGRVSGFTRRALAAALVVPALALAVAGYGRAATSPEAVVENLVQQIIDLLEGDELDGREGIRRLARTIDEDTDLDRLGRLVLGRHWRTASDDQRAEYETLFRETMMNKFVGHLGSLSGEQLDFGDDIFAVRGSRPIGGRDVIVDSVVRPPNRPPLDVAWRLRGDDGEDWVIIDLIVENVSLLISQRSEFSAVIERGGMDALLAQMRQRLASARS